MEDINRTLQQAVEHYRSGHLKEAGALFLECLGRAPQHPGILQALGLISIRRGDDSQAVVYLEKALALKPAGDLYAVMAVALQNLGRNEEALAAGLSALQKGQEEFRVYNTLGNALRGLGRFGEAEESFRKAVLLNPHSAELWFNAGNLAAEQRKWEEALRAYEKALENDPAMTGAWMNAGDMLVELGLAGQAGQRYLRAVEISPGSPEGYFKLGNLSHAQRKLSQAIEFYDYAVRLRPDHDGAHRNKGSVLYEAGRYDEAVSSLREAYRLNPSDGLRVKLATLIPPVVESVEAIDSIRKGLAENVDELLGRELQIGDPLKEVGNPNFFYMAYYGRNDRELMDKIASLFSFLPKTVLLPHCGRKRHRIRIGFISRFFFGHSVGSFFHTMIKLLAADEEFEVFAFCIGGLPELSDNATLRYVAVPVDLAEARRTVASYCLDILVYPDIGMEPLTYYLSFTRLAEAQCAMIGHLVTTGVPAVDYYLSSELIEPEKSEEHYTETLVKLRGMPCYIEKPSLATELKTRLQLGLSEERHIYLCPMRLNKVHPEFDAAVASILRRDSKGMAVFFRDREANDWHLLLRRRFSRTMPDLLDRIVFLPWAEAGDFRSIAATADVALDTFYYGGGVTASIIFPLGTPIVTWPGPFMRGRLTAGFYKRMGIEECIAKDQKEYVDIALRLAADSLFHDTVRSRILSENSVLYENREVIAELTAFFKAIHHRQGRRL